MSTLGTIISGKFDSEPKLGDGTSGGTEGPSIGTESNPGGIREPETIAGYPAHSPEYTLIGTDQPKRRGRPPGSKNRGPATPIASATFGERTTSGTKEATKDLASSSIADLEALLLSIHCMGASILSCPELELDDAEAKKLSNSIKNVAKHYPVAISAKKLAWADFAATAAGIYGTRAVAIFKSKPAARSGPVAVPSPTPRADTPVTQPKPSATPRPLNPHEVYGDGAGGDNY